MDALFLQAKLHIPESRTNLIPRSHLVEQINRGMWRKLTLISAPAGFGKTSLLSQWVPQSDRPVTWLSLEEDDDEIARFLSYLILAVQKINAHIGAELLAALQAPSRPQINTWLAMLVNEMDAIEEDFSLILDDYHVITSPHIHEALTFILDHSPPNFHLIIAGRTDPFLPVSRYRARGELTELRMEDLRFSHKEAERYLNQVRQLNLEKEDVLALASRTEGWISGIHLAALSLQGHESPSQFISDLAGDDRYIIDYLMDEVLAQRPKGTRDFLIKTSMLERMNAQLCEAVTGASDGRAMLSSLDQANLFIVPLDHRRHWYRYHRLFADLLKHLLEETLAQREIATLHQLASQWFEEHGLVFEAIEHSLSANDYTGAIRQIEQSAAEIFATGQLVPLTKLWDRLSREHLLVHPRVCMIFSWAWLATGHLQEADDCLRVVEESFGAKVSDLTAQDAVDLTPETHGALVEVAVIQSQLAFHRGQVAAALTLSQLALRLLDDEGGPHLYTPPSESRCVARFTLGSGHEFVGDLPAAERALKDALDLARKMGNIHILSAASGHLAKIHRIHGDLQRARQVCEQGIRDLQEMVGRSPMSGILLSEWGLIEYEQNNLDAARERFQEAISLAKLWGLWEALVPAHVGLARIRYAHGELDGVLQVLDELEALGRDNPERFMPVVESSRAMFRALAGDREGALEWARASGLDADHDIGYSQEEDHLVLARVLIATNRLDEADRLIGRLLTAAEGEGRIGRLIELLVLRAMSLLAQNNAAAALEAVSRALLYAEPKGHVRLFLDEGEPMRELLRSAHAAGIERDYASKLLAEFEAGHQRLEGRAFPLAASSRPPPSVEPLSPRELEVLRWLNSDLSGPEIARELTIALSTLRTHTQNIYSKLGVSSRRAAIRRAQELSLL